MILMLLLLKFTFAQDPDFTTALDCFSWASTYYFCGLISDTSVKESYNTIYEQLGNCCLKGTSDSRCVHGTTYTCTLDNTRTLWPLWATYWVGMSPSVCGTESRTLTAGSDFQTVVSSPLTIWERTRTSPYIEACYWTIKADQTEWNPQYSELFIKLDEAVSA